MSTTTPNPLAFVDETLLGLAEQDGANASGWPEPSSIEEARAWLDSRKRRPGAPEAWESTPPSCEAAIKALADLADLAEDDGEAKAAVLKLDRELREAAAEAEDAAWAEWLREWIAERPVNTWPAEDGGRWMRVEPLCGCGTLAWQLVDADGDLVGLYDDDGDRLHIGNASWIGVPSDSGPGWI
jgi:hypothetical protein